jgi:hypothetical protein
MLELFFQIEAWSSLVIGLILLGFGVAKRKPS